MICEKCGKEFFEDWRTDKRGDCRFCSIGCSNSRIHTEEMNEKTSASLYKFHGTEEKHCVKCGKKLAENNRSGMCKNCKPPAKTRNASVIEWRRRKKLILIEYKGGKCERCGYDKYIGALDFHHKIPSEKDFSISNRNIRSIEKYKKEVDKCILLCANCHREIHEEERKKLNF